MISASLRDPIPLSVYENRVEFASKWLSDHKKSLSESQRASLESIKKSARDLRRSSLRGGDPVEALDKSEQHKAEAKNLLKSMIMDFAKAGVTSSTGFNFYDLRGPVQLSYPVHVPLRNELARVGKVNAGVGTIAHWQSSRNPGYPYGGVSEGNRGPIATPSNENYVAPYKELGEEGSVTFTAEFAGEGFADNLADEQLRTLQRLWLQEESMNWFGNSGNTGMAGSGATGFRFGTAATPTTALVTTHTVGAAGNLSSGAGSADLPFTTQFTTANYASVAVVLLTAMGNPATNQYGYMTGFVGVPSIVGGLTPTLNRTNADGSVDQISGGTSAISATSTPLQCTTGNLTVKASIASVKGAFGYAWYVDTETTNTGSLANAKLAGITTTPFAFVSGTATGTQTGTAAGLGTDYSYNTLDYDGLFSFASATAGAGWTDLQGVSLTSEKNGRCLDVEKILSAIYSQYQAGVDKIWCSADAAQSLDQCIRYTGANSSAYQVFLQRNDQNNLLGGFVVSAYQSRYATNNPTGANAIPIVIHPMIPPGTIYFDVAVNPYPASRAPFSRAILLQRDYYAIQWPLTTRRWPVSVYTHQVLAHNFAWIPAVLTGIGAFNSSQ